MKLIIDKNKFNEVLNLASTVTENHINALHDNISLKAENNIVIFQFSNESTSIKYQLDDGIEIINNGEILIKFKTLKGIISKLQNEKITIEKIDNTLKISNSSFDANINLISLEEKPNIDFELIEKIKFSLKAQLFKEIEKKLFHSVISKDEKTSVANGICLDKTENDEINFISTNGYKISILKDKNDAQPFKIVLDIEFIKLINKCNFDNETEINFISDNNKIALKTSNMTIISKLLLGNFPNVYPAFNIEVNNSFEINAREFLNLIDHGIYIVNIEKMPIVSIRVNKDFLETKFSSIEIGTSFENTKISNFKGENEISFSLNAKFLSLLLKAYEQNDVIIKFSDKDHQIIFNDLTNKNFEQLILPIRN